MVLGNEELIVDAGEGVFDEGVVLLCAEQDADGWVVAFYHHILPIPAHVRVELSHILVREVLDLEVNENVALENAVIEHKIHEPVGVADQDALLSSFETKAMPQFKTKSVTFAFGSGLSLSSSYSLKNQMSVDTYLYLGWKSLFLEIDSMFFKDGSFHKNAVGFEFRIKKWALILCLNNLLNMGNEDIVYYPSLMAGTSYEF